MDKTKINKAQVSIEFLFGFLAYLAFISILLTALFEYSTSLKKQSEEFEILKDAEILARLYDAYESSYGHITIKIENANFEFFNNLITSKDSNIAIETLYEGGAFEAEPA